MKNITSKSVDVKGTPNHPITPAPEPLTDEQHDKFQKLEDQISDNLSSSFKLAAALAQIHDEKLYREEFDTFEEYCKKRWDYSRSYCERLAKMHGVVTDLKKYEDNQVFPSNELQARVFVPLKKDQRIKLLETVFKDSKTDRTTAAEFTKYRKQLWPEQFTAKTKSKGAAIDVESSVESLPEVPSIIKLVDSAKTVLEVLEDGGDDDNELGQSLREFLKQSAPVVEWEKAKLN